jgi:CBS domain containing-hemolysin-like protein
MVGILHTHDLLRSLLAEEPINLRELAGVNKARFVPETKPVDEMLTFFQQTHTHLALAVEEHGGLEGLLTLEDVLEEIVGEIHDEHDRPTTQIRRLRDGYMLDASVEVKQVEKLLSIPLGKTTAASVGGWMIEQFGHIPVPDERFDHAGWSWRVVDATPRAIGQIEVSRRRYSGRHHTADE